MDLDRPADGAGQDGIFVVVEAHRASLRHRSRNAMEAVEAAGIGDEAGALILETLPDCAVALLRMSMRLGRVLSLEHF
jgi:hypothetical protein